MTPFVLEVVDGVRVSEHSGDLLHRPPSVWNGHVLTCQTCDGKGEYMMATDYDGLGRFDPIVDECPDCVDGHPIIVAEQWTSCGRCDPYSSHLWGEAGDYGETCVDIGCDQIVQGRSVPVSVQAVPIVTMATACMDNPPPLPLVLASVRPDGSTVVMGIPDDHHETPITLPVDARPGQYAIIAEQAGR